MSLGFHLIELSGEHPELGKTTVQMPLTIISPVEISVPPLTEVSLTDDDNGGFVQARVRNQSRSGQSVAIGIGSTPPGWMAMALGDAVLFLQPGEEVDVTVQIERMVTPENSGDPLAFSLNASFAGGSSTDLCSTFYVSAN